MKSLNAKLWLPRISNIGYQLELEVFSDSGYTA